jgi:hypothetical protein
MQEEVVTADSAKIIYGRRNENGGISFQNTTMIT